MTGPDDRHHEISKGAPAVGVGIMVTRDNKVLMGLRSGSHGSGTYGWPGGGLKFGERLEDAVRREALEEVGIQVRKMKLVCVSNIIAYGRHYIDFEFQVTEFDGEPTLLEPEKSSEWRWYDLNDLPQPLFRPCEIAVRSLKNGLLLND